MAARLEELGTRDTGLYPGMPKAERQAAIRIAEVNEHIRFRVAVWRAMAADLADHCDSGRLRVIEIDAAGAARIEVIGSRSLHVNFQGKPILHLDATLRPELARRLLPGLIVTEIDAAAPHMAVRPIDGSFGKGSLCPDPRANAQEAQRRANRLAECVGYVRWHARRVAPGRMLVVTYKAIETAFDGIAGVETGHFNAIAGLVARYRAAHRHRPPTAARQRSRSDVRRVLRAYPLR